jgi:acetylglutamate kinase
MQTKPNDILRAAGRYVRLFRDSVFVIKLGGELIADARALNAMAEQISLLWSFSVPMVLVHGGGPQLDKLCDRLGIEVQKHKGRRITDEETLQAAKYQFGAAQLDLVAALSACGVSAVGLSGLDTGLFVARRRPVKDGVDFGFVGDLESVDTSVLHSLMSAGHLPVIAPLTGDKQGNVFNTNADTLAAELALTLGARKLIYLMRAPGLLSDPEDASSLIPAADIERLDELEKAGQLTGGMQPKAASIRHVLKHGVPAVHLVNGFDADALLTEIFTNEGSGTMLTLKHCDAESAA